jgi:hypothetical protein
MDRDLKTLGLIGIAAALEMGGDEIARAAVAGADKRYGDNLVYGHVVSDPVYRDLLDEFGIDPDTVWFPPTGVHPDDYTLNDLVEMTNKSARRALAEWLPEGKGTDRGSVEVELVNEFVEDFFPRISDEGAEWEYSLGPAEKVLHDLLDEVYESVWPENEEEQIAFVENLLSEAYGEGG